MEYTALNRMSSTYPITQSTGKSVEEKEETEYEPDVIEYTKDISLLNKIGMMQYELTRD